MTACCHHHQQQQQFRRCLQCYCADRSREGQQKDGRLWFGSHVVDSDLMHAGLLVLSKTQWKLKSASFSAAFRLHNWTFVINKKEFCWWWALREKSAFQAELDSKLADENANACRFPSTTVMWIVEVNSPVVAIKPLQKTAKETEQRFIKRATVKAQTMRNSVEKMTSSTIFQS